MPTIHGSHVSDEVLEQYALGGLPEEEQAPLEEHLLVCHACQDRLEEVDTFVRSIRAAAAKLRAEPAPRKEGFQLRFPRIWSMPAPVWAMAAATCLVIGFLVVRSSGRSGVAGSPPVAVALETVRGIEGGATAPAGKPLQLSAGLEGLPALSAYRIELVDAGGARIWDASATGAQGRLAVQFPGKLQPGQYWVRVFEPSPKSELLREFGLRVR